MAILRRMTVARAESLRPRATWALGLAALAAIAIGARDGKAADGLQPLPYGTASTYQDSFRNKKLQGWRERVPKVQVIEIKSSVDGARQKTMWYDSGSAQKRPLLVVLHSWGSDYRQNLDIPFAEFAITNDWAFIHPDFRGPNRRPQATASDLAVQDVLDAVAEARKRAAIDENRVYLVGYSGGAMKALVLAGRHPEVWAGVVAWGAIFDIVDWYRFDHKEKRYYRREIGRSCGGPPNRGSAAEAECQKRSPITHLAGAAGRVPVLIAHGLQDETVPLRQAVDSYNVLAAPDERIAQDKRDFIDQNNALPNELRSGGEALPESVAGAFARAGAPVELSLRSRAATLVFYKGGHDMVYNATMAWLDRQRRR
ncbi:MAG TPA: alpha/beta fold hydrolase [Polyangia bacterium]